MEINVLRELVIIYERVTYPAGVARRRWNVLKQINYMSEGSNGYWHIGGYYNQKLFQFSIHGYFDGHSEKELWLKVG